MNIYIVLLGIASMVGGGILGLYRSSIVSVVFISGFFSYTSYKAFHNTLGYAIMSLGCSETTAFFVSLFIVVLVPLFMGMVLGMKIIHKLHIDDYFSEDTYYSTGTSIVDRIGGAGFNFTIFIIIYSLFMR